MGYQAGEKQGANAPAETHDVATPGKRTRTEEITMTGVDAIDLADSIAEQDQRDGFSPAARATAMALVISAIGAMFAAIRQGLSNAFTDESTLKVWRVVEWSMKWELAWRIGTAPLTPLLSQALATVTNGFAIPAAELGLTRTAWTLAADARSMHGLSATLLTAMRTHLAHPHAPEGVRDELAFILLMQTAQGAAQNEMVPAALLKPTRDLAAFYVALQDPALVDVGMYTAAAKRMIQMFRDNRIASIGDTLPVYGGIDVATVRRVRFRGRTFMVLLASRAHEGIGVGPRQELVFIRFVEKEMHSLAGDQLRQKQGEHPSRTMADAFLGHEPDELIDFDTSAARGQHSWFGDAYAAYLDQSKRRTLDTIAESGDNPYALHMVDADAP